MPNTHTLELLICRHLHKDWPKTEKGKHPKQINIIANDLHHGFATALGENWGIGMLAYPLAPTIVQSRVSPPPKTLPSWQPSRPLQVVEQDGRAKGTVVIRSWECQHSRDQTGPYNGSYHQSVHIQHHHHPHTAKVSTSNEYRLQTKIMLRIRSNSSACTDLQMVLAKLASSRLWPTYCIAEVSNRQLWVLWWQLTLMGKLPGYNLVWQTVDDVSRSWHWFISWEVRCLRGATNLKLEIGEVVLLPWHHPVSQRAPMLISLILGEPAFRCICFDTVVLGLSEIPFPP